MIKIDVKLENVWLSQQQMPEFSSTLRTNVIENINNIYEE